MTLLSPGSLATHPSVPQGNASPRKCIQKEQRDTRPGFRNRWHESFSHVLLLGNILCVVGAVLRSSTPREASPEGQRATALHYLSQVAAPDSHQEPAVLALVGFQHQGKRLGRVLFFRVQVNMRAVLEGRPLQRAPWNPNAIDCIPSQLPGGLEGSGGDPSDERTHRSPRSSLLPSCRETAEALGDILRPLIRGSVRRASYPTPHTLFCFASDTMDTKRHNFSKARAPSSCSVPYGFMIWSASATAQRHRWFALQDSIFSGSGKVAEM